MEDFIKQMAPVLVANALTVIYVYGIWRVTKWEREGRSAYRPRDLIMMIVPPLFLLYGLYLWGGLEATPLRHLVGQNLPQ